MIKIDDVSDISAKAGGNSIFNSVYTSGVGGNGFSGGEYVYHIYLRTTRTKVSYLCS